MKTNIKDSDLHKLVQLIAQTGTPENDEHISKKLSEQLAARREELASGSEAVRSSIAPDSDHIKSRKGRSLE